jgi:hypothetical protein
MNMSMAKALIVLAMLYFAILFAVLLPSCEHPTEPESKLEIGTSVLEEYGLVFWAYVEPDSDTIWAQLRWSWGTFDSLAVGAMAVKPVGGELESTMVWKAWTRELGPDSLVWRNNGGDT